MLPGGVQAENLPKLGHTQMRPRVGDFRTISHPNRNRMSLNDSNRCTARRQTPSTQAKYGSVGPKQA